MRILIAIVALLTIAYAAQAQNPDPNATLTKASIQFDTPPDVDNSEVSAVVSITAGPPPGLVVATSPVVASHAKSEEVNLGLKSDKVTRKQLSDAVVFIQFVPEGSPSRDRWIFGYTMRLTFSDGQEFCVRRAKNVLLDRQNRTEVQNLCVGGLFKWKEDRGSRGGTNQ
jgi:hypothetical protein